MPEETLLAFADHGTVRGTLGAGPDPDNDALLARFEAAGVDLADFARRLQEGGVESFVRAWWALLGLIDQKAAAVSKSR
jgi:transaldolase